VVGVIASFVRSTPAGVLVTPWLVQAWVAFAGTLSECDVRQIEKSTRRNPMALRKFIIERDIPAVGSLEREQLRGAAAKSNETLRQLGPDIQWVESYVADNKTFCVYLAKDEAIIKKHAEISGFPATKITEVRKMIDPTTEQAG
jgi:hypothetical protein